MFRFLPFITSNNTYKLCLMNSLRFCSSTSISAAAAPPPPLEVANTNNNNQQESLAPYFSACDMELVPISPEIFAIRSVGSFSGATSSFMDHFKASNGRFNKSMVDPRTKRSFGGWTFPTSCQSSMESWMKSLLQESIPKDFKKIVAPNGAVELVRLNDRWYVIRSTEEHPMSTSFYAEALKSQLSAGFAYHLSQSEMNEEDRVVSKKNNNNNNENFENKPFPGWLVAPKNRQRAEDWMKSLVVLPKMNGSFQTRSSNYFQKKKKQNSEGLTLEEKNKKRIENGRLNGMEDWSPQ